MSLLMVEEEEQPNKSTMEAQELEGVAATTETVAATPSSYVSNNISILKGKRTKRQRPQSPLPFTLAPANSSSNNGGGCDCVNSTTTTTDEDSGSSPTPEEEDTAKCLLLLSQGGQKNDNNFGTVPFKFSSKVYLETNTTTNGKAGMYVYQCKTCDRTFPSFQALGGHRASHRKPKNTTTATATQKSYKPIVFSDEDEDHNHQQQQQTPFKRSFSASSLSLQLSTRVISSNTFNNIDYNKSSPKVHECAICGTEFSSGQALGGHMRRHRGVPLHKTVPTAIANTKTLSLIPFSPNPISAIDYHPQPKKLKSGTLNLSLDLNLPASAEDQQQKQSPLVLSTTPALVNCQY